MSAGNANGITPAPSPEEAAAIIAAIERFVADTVPAPEAPPAAADGWARAALLEGVRRAPPAPESHPWINT
jgi:hypothetical protein